MHEESTRTLQGQVDRRTAEHPGSPVVSMV